MPPAMVSRGTGCERRYFSTAPAKSPMSSNASSGRPYSSRATCSEVLPVQPATCVYPAARATSTPRRMLSIQAEQEYGTTTPVVPRIDSPPRMPSRGFQVLRAISSPWSTEISTTTSPVPPCCSATYATCSLISRRGTGLIAGSPTASGRPGLVTVPTPGPARNVTPAPGAPYRTVARTSAPWVTSGSSPASLTTPAIANPSPSSSTASANAGLRSFGSRIPTGSGNSPVSNAVYAAVLAAVAHAPVVQPYRRPVPGC